jgi:cholesterol oxidase
MDQLSKTPDVLGSEYTTVVVGSGYGGAITAARLAERGQPVAILERGKEWHPGDFPDTLSGLGGAIRNRKHPLGYVDYYFCDGIDVLKGSGLGGTSIVNANVAMRPDMELFDDPRWPKVYQDLAASGDFGKYYHRAEEMLRVKPHPNALNLGKVKALQKIAGSLTDNKFWPVPIAVNFDVDGKNHVGVDQKPCINCNDCITGCNVGAKNTLYMNYIPYAKQKGAEIFTQIEVLHIAKKDGAYIVYYRKNTEGGYGETRQFKAKRVILSGGAVGSSEILMRSVANGGLSVSKQLGSGFTGNGDFIGLAYNTHDRTDVLGFGNHPESERAAVAPGPTITSAIQYDRSKPVKERITVQDFCTFPSGLVDFFRLTLPGLAGVLGKSTREGMHETVDALNRIRRDLVGWNPEGASNHSMVFLVMAFDGAKGKMSLDAKNKIRIDWPDLNKNPIFKKIDEAMLAQTRVLGGVYTHLGRFNPWTQSDNLITAHPLGGCNLARDADGGVVDSEGRVYDGQGGVHEGLHVVDGAIIPMALGVNPLITISALAERIAEKLAPVA